MSRPNFFTPVGRFVCLFMLTILLKKLRMNFYDFFGIKRRNDADLLRDLLAGLNLGIIFLRRLTAKLNRFT